jgi:hypothetical protein
MSDTVVVFRRDRTGCKDCFALFPELPSDEYGNLCTAYQHVGQHCAADYHGCVAASDPASPADYRDLYEELERRGYHLTVRRRATPDMHERRRRTAAEWRGEATGRQAASAAR